jgi:uncharacterized Zn-finger protein
MILPPPLRRFLHIYSHINYWISNTEWPGIGGGEEFFTEAVEVNKYVLNSFYINFIQLSFKGSTSIWH